MDTQPVIPTNSNPFNTGAGPSTSKGPLLIILVVILGLGAVVFAILAIVFFSKANTATGILNSEVTAATEKAKADQKKADDEATIIANGLPFRSYVAPSEFGSFEIKFPKDWSSYVDQQRSGTQVSLTLNPEFVRRVNGVDELMATRVQFVERTKDQFMQTFNSQIKQGKIKQTEITVSGQKAIDLNGAFPDKRAVRLVIVPVRDKVLVFINENAKQAAQFNEILTQAKIIP